MNQVSTFICEVLRSSPDDRLCRFEWYGAQMVRFAQNMLHTKPVLSDRLFFESVLGFSFSDILFL